MESESRSNLLDGGAHFYGTYETKDGKHKVYWFYRTAVLARCC